MSVFQMAILFTLVWKTIISFSSSSPYNIEAFIVIMLELGGCLGALIHVLVFSSRPRATNIFLDFVSTARMLGFASYGVWFRYIGVQSLMIHPLALHAACLAPMFTHGLMHHAAHGCSSLEFVCTDGSPCLAESLRAYCTDESPCF